MEIKRYIPEITAVGIVELGAGALATKRALEGNPMNVKELVAYFGFVTFYSGIPAAIVIHAVREALSLYKKASSRNKTWEGEERPTPYIEEMNPFVDFFKNK